MLIILFVCKENKNNNKYHGTLVKPCRRLIRKKINCWIKVIIFVFMHTKSIPVASHYSWTTDVTWTLLPFWALSVTVLLLSMQGQKALRFHQKYLNLCFEDERRSGLDRHEGGLLKTEFSFLYTNKNIFCMYTNIPFLELHDPRLLV